MSTTSMRELFEQALALPTAERAPFLDLHCADPKLRDQVERLLAGAQSIRSDPPLQRDPAQWAIEIGESALTTTQAEGTSIGPFRIQALLGEGGSARVFRASRTVEGVAQTVALKVLRQGLWAESARSQFDRERHALVRLVHPNIAQFIDGGISELGEAYIALEYVDGVQLLQYAREQQLSFRERLRLMIDVAHAVSAAHRSLIVHRDIKPGNVLVTGSGDVKLLDFGIAKLLEPELDDSHRTLTQFRAFTPAYAAPEQREGGAITTATDVYALGVLLGELLTGERITNELSKTASEQVIAKSAPGVLPTSARLTRRWLRSDLDNILLKATATLSEYRYETAAAFAEDIERLLAGQPVSAHPPSGWYRMRKFVGRHRGGVTAAIAVVLAVLSALAVAIWQADVARQEAERARSVSQFLVGLFRAAEDRLPRNQRPTPDQLVETAMTQLAVNRTMDSATRAEIESTLGEVSRLGARYPEALALFRAAASSLGKVPAADPRVVRLRIGEAQVLQQLGKNDEALAAIDALNSSLDSQQTELRISALAVETAANVSVARYAQALTASRQREQLARAARGQDHPDTLRASMSVGVVLVTAERFRESLDELNPALLRWRELSLPLDRDFMEAAGAQANALYGLSELADAEARLRDLLAVQRSIYREPHDEIATTLRNYAAVLAGAGKSEQAVVMHRDSIAMLVAVYGMDHEQLVTGHTQFGIALASAYRLEEAEAEYLTAIAICERSGLFGIACARAR
ncbi:MAG: protein kinase, partial [Pseudomonadota bacterium]|nr:protein kinase [Pseudomonadota bacterium]